ncbi:phosphoglucosamine mutase [Tepidanaerobacter acetatoxydans Re1]|uniref:Phosphoglucosamine mutase n=1 Tax=Tepidanaerobacter acetatoxydans (strain DSM 21804 / JCM 16047 / Re1) TaxID=1209989 RepID=F4LU02_TEPAE|nr:phosphoglucosamine mutase [Tepidanaerobacter acetatoxydans]AEE90528.1 phosphoglucosamine mutase [Tepidanaerobacter acetatoxydans Re1]CCP25039.1 phosphoglucosamine mutase [Tepidanaerobacter acetatoxydans Re1]
MKSRLFGTDGVRGVANKDLSPLLAFKLGRAGAQVLSKLHKKPIMVVGKDTRISGDLLEAALIAGMCSQGADVLKVGIMPTPAIAYLTRHFNADAGVVISASHNPFEYNGIKFFDKNGYKLPDAMEDEIEALLEDTNGEIKNPIGSDVGKTYTEDAIRPYVDFIKSVIDKKLKFRGLKVALDCANGASYQVAPIILEELGADVHIINNQPDGTNINVNCGSTHPESLCKYVREIRADVGLSFDGDADRLIAVDEKGEIVDGDHIMAICGVHLKSRGLLKNETVVSTVMSNMGLEVALKNAGIQMMRAKVGDRYVLEEMLSSGYNFGGEQSGHIIFLDYNTTGDGILTGVKLIDVMVNENKTLSELRQIMKVYPQILINVTVADKSGYDSNKRIQEIIAENQELLGEKGRILVRPSGTEPLIRVMVEGEQQDLIEKVAKSVAEVIEQELR